MAVLTAEAQAGTVESSKDIGNKPADIVKYWLAQDKLAEKELNEWWRRGRKVLRRYRDERASQQLKTGARFNVLWANIEVLKPVLYARTPKPDIAPRWIDTQESVVRLAALILERSLSYICDRHDIDSVIGDAVKDRLLPGAGFARIRYEPTFGDEAEDPDNAGQIYRPVTSEVVRWSYEYWEDVAWSPARRWEELTWLRFRAYMTRDELVTRFGSKIGKAVPLDYTPKGMDKEDKELPPDLFKKATVLEFWDKTEKKVCWIAKEYSEGPLDEQDDPLKLDGFWPCPKPLLATTTTDKLVPVPDFAQYQDQADALDIIAARIEKLTWALKVAGVYAASEKASLGQLLQEGTDNLLIPVEDWAVFAQTKGGLEGSILWLPIKTIVEVLEKLYESFDKQKELLYEISGLADIMRGASEAEETLGAQRIKAQFGTIRTQQSQKDVGRFARDLFRLAGQVVSRHLDTQTISEITGLPELPQPVQQPQPPAPMVPMGMGAGPATGVPPGQPAPQGAPPAPAPAQPAPGAMHGAPALPSAPVDPMAKYQQDLQAYQAYQAELQRRTAEFEAACALLKQDMLRTFRLDIEADSTISPDEQAEKESRVEFVTALGTLLKEAVPFIQQAPQAGGALIAETLKFVAHGFRAGRPLEETIDKFADYLDKLPPPQPHIDPAIAKVQSEAEIAKMKMAGEQQAEQARLAAEQARESARLQADNQRETVALNAKMQREDAKIAADKELGQQKIAAELAKARIAEDGKTNLELAKVGLPPKGTPLPAPVVHVHVPTPLPAKPKRFRVNRDAGGNMMGVEEVADEPPPA